MVVADLKVAVHVSLSGWEVWQVHMLIYCETKSDKCVREIIT
jgi:hypothetical protein